MDEGEEGSVEFEGKKGERWDVVDVDRGLTHKRREDVGSLTSKPHF